MMFRTPEHGSVDTRSLFLTTIKMNPTYLSNPEVHYALTWRTTKRVPFQTLYKKVAKKVILRRRGYMMERIRIILLAIHRILVRNHITVTLLTPAVRLMTCVITRSRTAMTITDTDNFVTQKIFPVYPTLLYGAPPETTPTISHFFIPELMQSTYYLNVVFWGYLQVWHQLPTQHHQLHQDSINSIVRTKL